MFTRRALAVLAILAASAMAQDACPAGIALLFKGTPEVRIYVQVLSCP